MCEPEGKAMKGTSAGELERQQSPNARMRFSAFNLANTIVGGGILSLPYAVMVRGENRGKKEKKKKEKKEE